MSWKNSSQIRAWLKQNLDRGQRERSDKLYAIHSFVIGALPIKGWALDSDFNKAIALSNYGGEALSRLDVSAYSEQEIKLACVLVFFYRDFLVDIERSDPDLVISMLEAEIVSGKLRLPQMLGRDLYDKFNAMPEQGRIEHLESSLVDTFLDQTEQGVFQVGRLITGPLGIIRSRENRFLPPDKSLPLWHCADPGCLSLHRVALLPHKHPARTLALQILAAARDAEGPPSEWDLAFARSARTRSPEPGKTYYDIAALIAEGFARFEKQELLKRGFREKGFLEDVILHCRLAKKRFDRKSREQVVDQISDREALQLLLSISDHELVGLIDAALRSRSIKLPATETRSAKTFPPKLSAYDTPSTLSALGIRADRKQPVLYFSAIVWNEYEKAGQLAELAWRCQTNSAQPKPGLPVEYLRSHSLREAVRNLILPSQPITLSIASRLGLQLVEDEQDDETIDRFLWKFGFSFARYDRKYQRLRSQLSLLRQEAINAPPRLTADHRDSLRSRGVNLFVSMENFIEELISFNVWLLSSDHFVGRFAYTFEDATKQVSRTLGRSLRSGQASFNWSETGGNTLGCLLVYARAAANWMLKFASADRSRVKRAELDLPFYTSDPNVVFPFLHYELWADAHSAELNDYATQFESIVSQLERSQIAEVRNGFDHYRDEETFPSVDSILTCEQRLFAAFETADINRFIPKAFSVVQKKTDEFGLIEYELQDYADRKVTLHGPSVAESLLTPEFSESWIIPYGNLLGRANSTLVLSLKETSLYSLMWANYPTRRGLTAPIEQVETISILPNDELASEEITQQPL